MNILKFKKLKNWKLVLVILLAALFLNLSINVVFAQATTTTPVTTTGKSWFGNIFSLIGIGDVSGSAITFVTGVIGYIFGFVISALFTLGGWLVTFALNINLKLLESPIVESGWQVVLNFANLGFVLAIIVIAFATIFRVQSYAMKQTLWKLIVAALLVNFSLVIAGAFINVSDIMTNLFLKQATLEGEGFTKFSDTLANALGVQTFLEAKNIKDVTGALNTFGTGILTIITSIFFVAGFTLIGAITLLAIAIMLLIRYVFLGILLVLSPIVWLLWIFPATSEHWKTWWKQFIRWTFFAPIMLFFLSLATLTLSEAGKKYKLDLMTTTKNATAAMNVNTPFTFGFDAVGNLVIVLGLMMGGLFAANSLGITFGSTAFGWAQSIGKSFGGWVGRKGIQAGTSPFRSKWGTKAIEAIEKFGATKGRFLKTITQPIRAQVGERLSSLAATGAEKAVAAAGKRYSGYDDKRLAGMIYSLDAPERVAALQRLKEKKTLDLLPDASAFINQETEDLFVKYGQPRPDYRNMERVVGYDADTLRALREPKGQFEKKVIDEETGEKKTITVTLESAKKAFWKDFKPEHATKMQIDDYFRPDKKLGIKMDEKRKMHSEDVKAILETNPDILANVYRGIKGINLDNFNEHLFGFIDSEVKRTGMATRRKWLESVEDPVTHKKKYERLITWMDSPAARSLGAGLGSEDDKKGKQSAGPTMPGYESGKYND